MHADIADAQTVVAGKLPFYCDVPLVRLRIAVVRINPLIQTATAILHTSVEGAVFGNWMSGVPAAVVDIGIGVKVGCRVAAVVKGERPKIGHGVNAKAGTDNRLRVIEWTVGHRNAWLKVALVGIAQPLREMILARSYIIRAGQR